MLPLHTQEFLRDRERELRRRTDDERRRRAARDRDDPWGIDAEIRLLVEREVRERPCFECEDELTRAAG
jgi:hypothetical protein